MYLKTPLRSFRCR